MPTFPLRLLTRIFLRIGNTTFGGGDPTIAALQRELVDRRRAITPHQYSILYALARITPGTNMLALCAGAGWTLSGWAGALIAVLAVTVPSAVIAVLLVTGFERVAQSFVAATAIRAMIAAAVGLMLAAALLLLRPHVRRSTLLRTASLASGSFVLVWKQILPPVQVLACAAILGYLWPEPVER